MSARRTPQRPGRAVDAPDAARLAQRLSRLQQVAGSLLRSLDVREVQLELSAQLGPLLDAEWAVVAEPAGEGDSPVRVAPAALDAALDERVSLALCEVKATGRPSRVGSGAGVQLLAVPVLTGFRMAAVLVVGAAREAPFGSADEELLLTVARLTGTALMNAQLYAVSERERRASDALAELAAALGASLRPAEVVRLGLRHAMGLLRSEAADVMLLRGDFLHVVAAEGTARALEGLYLPLSTSLSGRAVTEGRTVFDNGVARTRSAHPMVLATMAVSNAIVTPLRGPDGSLGAIAVMNRAEPFDERDVRDLERMAAQVSVALLNARLFEAADAVRTELTAAFESMSGAMAVVDGDGRIVRHNARLLELSGAADAAAVVGRGLYEALLHEPLDVTPESAVGRALAGLTARESLAAAWSGRRLVLSAAPHPGGGAVVTVEDVTEAERAREEAEAANTRYRELFDIATDVIVTVDLQGHITSVNAAAGPVLGYEPAELLGRSMFPLVDPEDTPILERSFAECLAGSSTRFETRIVRRDGTRRLMAIGNTPIRRGGAIVGALGIGRDVTDERDRQSALERAESRFTRLVESGEDAICTVDEEGTITSANPAFARVMAQPREVLVGRQFGELLDPAEHEQLWPIFVATVRGERRRAEVSYTDRSDGRPYIASVVTAPLVEEGGRVSGGIAIFRDVTEERRLLEQLARNDKLASLGELVGGVAHEVNTPLASILAYGQLLHSGRIGGDDARGAAESIVAEAKRAGRLVSRLLGYARPATAERTVTDVVAVLRDVIELRRFPMKNRQVTLSQALPEGAPAVWADPFQLQQVFMNLLANAEQAVAELPDPAARRVGVRVDVYDDAVGVTVEDGGPGIADAHLPHLFNPFFTTKPRGVGTGLGLSIVEQIVREHGGTVAARNRPDGGAAFEVRLPRHAPQGP